MEKTRTSSRKWFRMLSWVLVAGALVVAGLFAMARIGSRPLDPEARSRLLHEGRAHAFVELSEGFVHYRDEGDPDASTFVLVHGLSTPSWVWDEQIAPMVAAGYRVVSFDNYGRGWSARPRGPYDIDRTDRLLVELLAALEIQGPIHLVGYSMGGAVAAVFASRRSELIESLALIAPAGIEPVESRAVEWLRLPGLGDWLVAVFGKAIFVGAQAQDAKVLADPDAFLARFEAQMEFEGYGRALLSTLRHYPLLDGMAETYRAVGRAGIRTLAVFGQRDESVPEARAEALARLIPEADIVVLPDLNHALTYSHPARVSEVILAHARRGGDPEPRGAAGD